MFERAGRATIRGFLQWPDLFVFGLLAFGLTLILDTLVAPIWNGLISGDTSPVIGALIIFAQQFVLTFASFVIAVAAARIALARMVGRQMSIVEGLSLTPLLRPIATYTAIYTAITSAMIIGYLVLMYGATGLSFASLTTTSGLTGLTQAPTVNLNPSVACLTLLVFVPAFIAWMLANLLVAPVIAAEQTGGTAAIRRSWYLVRHSVQVVVGLLAVGLLAGCSVSLLISIFVVTPEMLTSVQLGAEIPVLPELPPLLSAVLSALLFMVGAIFGAAWYLVAAEAAAPASLNG